MTKNGDKIFIKITNSDLYDKLLEMEDHLKNIDRKSDGVKWQLRGLWLVIGGIIGFLVKFLAFKT